MRVDVQDLDCDFYAVSGQKWLLGPEGTGALWCDPAIVAQSQPTNASWFTFDTVAGGANRQRWYTLSGPVVTGHTLQYLREADVVFGIGCSFTRHGMAASIPAGKTLIHATNDERDLNKSYAADYPLLGDARLVLRQFIEAVKSQGGRPAGRLTLRGPAERQRRGDAGEPAR